MIGTMTQGVKYSILHTGEDIQTSPASTPVLLRTSFILLQQGFFKALLCFCRECCVRDLADFFGKLARDFTHVIELLRIALAKRAHEIMDAQLDPRRERKPLVHT